MSKLKWIVSLAIITLVFSILDPTATKAQTTTIPAIEKEALIALYNSTDGENWNRNDGWLIDPNPCNWYGIWCWEGHVVEIALGGNGLSGTIPLELSDLSLLEDLRLDHNQLSGQLPAGTLNKIPNLYIIHLHQNKFSGSLPPELFSHSPCYDLFLHQNQISGPIPPEIGDFECAYFTLSGNRLSGAIPPEIGGGHFDTLDLSNNALSGEIPTTITNLNLECQYLGGIHQYWICNDSLIINNNMLSSSDSDVIAYLNKYDGGWTGTQTIPPTDLSVVDVSPTTVELSWTPIQYTEDGGYYQISYAEQVGGPYTIHGKTSDKTASSYTIDNLSRNDDYYIVIQTFTPAHDEQKNDLLSEYSYEIVGVPRVFWDVLPTHWALPFVETIYEEGITTGCYADPLNYCPEENTTRAETAVFLEKGIHGAGFTPPDVTPTFGDTAGHWAEDWIEALYSDGMTSGCSLDPLLFCPDSSTTRAEMAVFLLKAKHGNTYTPSPASGGAFSDVAGHWAEAWIEQLAAEGITSGYPDGTFKPDKTVTRAEMAVFLVKTFNLPVPKHPGISLVGGRS